MESISHIVRDDVRPGAGSSVERSAKSGHRIFAGHVPYERCSHHTARCSWKMRCPKVADIAPGGFSAKTYDEPGELSLSYWSTYFSIVPTAADRQATRWA